MVKRQRKLKKRLIFVSLFLFLFFAANAYTVMRAKTDDPNPPDHTFNSTPIASGKQRVNYRSQMDRIEQLMKIPPTADFFNPDRDPFFLHAGIVAEGNDIEDFFPSGIDRNFFSPESGFRENGWETRITAGQNAFYHGAGTRFPGGFGISGNLASGGIGGSSVGSLGSGDSWPPSEELSPIDPGMDSQTEAPITPGPSVAEPVPEPATIFLMGVGLTALAVFCRKRVSVKIK